MKIHLVRHGEIDKKYEKQYCGHLDVPLSPKGLSQNKAAYQFALKNNCRIITSDLHRTFDGVPHAEHMPQLREISFGEWEGLTWKQIEKKISPRIKRVSYYSFNLEISKR